MQIWALHSQLLVAIQDNDLVAAAEVLEKEGMDSDVRFYVGSHRQIPAICLCVERGLYQMAKLLIDYGCSVNQVDDCGYTPLHFAASHQFLDLVNLLVSHRANVNAVSNYGHTPLHLAAQQSSVDVAKSLVEAGSNLEKLDSDGKTALALACISNQRLLVDYLVKRGADVNTVDFCGNSPLLHALNSGLCLTPETVDCLLEGGADANHSNKYGQTPLITAVRRSSDHCLIGQETVATLIGHGCNLNESESASYGETPLHLSISRGQDNITETLIRSGCDIKEPNQRGFSPVHRLASEGKKQLVKLLLAAGASVDVPNKQFWVDEDGILRDIRDSELRDMLTNRRKGFPTLKHLSRVRLRQWLERRADSVIRQLRLPVSIRHYLLLREL